MKNDMDFCVHECPYYADPVVCLSGTACPLKQKKRQRIKNCAENFGRCFGHCLFAAVCTGNWSVMYILPILCILTLR